MAFAVEKLRHVRHVVHAELHRSSRNPRLTIGIASFWCFASLLLLAGAPRKHRWSMLTMFYRSLWMCMRSAHLRNMFLFSAAFSYMVHRHARAKVSLPLSFGALYLLYYHFAVKEYPRVRYQATYWNNMIVEKARLAQKPFCPTIWGISRHAQTITCNALSAVEWLWSKPVHYVREEIPCWDGNEIHLDWVDEVLRPESEVDGIQSRPICIFIHGLGDDRYHPALLRMARLCRNRGWRVVVFSYWRFDFSETRDLQSVVEHISKLSPQSPMLAIGWSAGGHILLNYLGTVRKATPLVCAVALSPALDFTSHLAHMQFEENSVYYRFLALQSMTCLRRHIANDKRILEPEKFTHRIRGLGDLDGGRIYDKFLAACPSDHDFVAFANSGAGVTHGSFSKRRQASVRKRAEFKDADDHRVLKHYPKANENFEGIGVPLLVIYSNDDPITKFDADSILALERNRNVIMVNTLRGGHVGYYDTFFPGGTTWDARTAAAYISTVLETLSQTHYLLGIVQEAALQGLLRDIGDGNHATQSACSGNHLALRPAVMRRICSQSDVRLGAL